MRSASEPSFHGLPRANLARGRCLTAGRDVTLQRVVRCPELMELSVRTRPDGEVPGPRVTDRRSVTARPDGNGVVGVDALLARRRVKYRVLGEPLFAGRRSGPMPPRSASADSPRAHWRIGNGGERTIQARSLQR